MTALTFSLALKSQSKIKMSGGFGSPIINISQIGESTALTIRGGGGFIINSRLFIGGYALSFYDDVSYIRPILEYEYRFSKIFSLAAGMSWAFYNNFDIPVYEARDLSQPAANITFKLGWIQ